MPTSPDVLNYFLGSGNVYWTPSGGAQRHVGNCIKFEVGVDLTLKEHNERMTAARGVDVTHITASKGKWAITLEEITLENLQMAFLGTLAGSTVSALGTTVLRGQLELVGTNDQGAKYTVTIPNAQVTPSATFDFLAENDGALEIEGSATGSPPFTVLRTADGATA
jgi:hypothetical protein